MTQVIETLQDIASDYDAIVFDQWGVLHNGTSAYAGAVAAIAALADAKPRIGVLSNSGKRAAPNLARIAQMGFAPSAFDHVMTSGEALWRDMADGVIAERCFYPVERSAGDAAAWAQGLDITLTQDASDADAILLMGLPDGATLEGWSEHLGRWLERDLPVYCSNPDRKSPRAAGLVISPGALAFDYADRGGNSVFYGKPHLPIFRALEGVFGTGRILMVGDSLEHDIAGAQTAGWDSLLVEGGLYADAFRDADGPAALDRLVTAQGIAPPTYRIKEVR